MTGCCSSTNMGGCTSNDGTLPNARLKVGRNHLTALRTVVMEDSHMIMLTVVSLLIWVDANPEYETPVNIVMDSPYHRPLPTYYFSI